MERYLGQEESSEHWTVFLKSPTVSTPLLQSDQGIFVENFQATKKNGYQGVALVRALN